MSSTTQKNMIIAGAILFLLGLLTGFVIPNFLNPRMGLASHLEAVMNGTVLIAIGAAWSHVRLTVTLDKITFWLIAYGTYANWLFTALAGLFGTSETTPIAGHGFKGLVWQEQLVTMGLISVGITLVLGCGFIVYGLIRNK